MSADDKGATYQTFPSPAACQCQSHPASTVYPQPRACASPREGWSEHRTRASTRTHSWCNSRPLLIRCHCAPPPARATARERIAGTATAACSCTRALTGVGRGGCGGPCLGLGLASLGCRAERHTEGAAYLLLAQSASLWGAEEGGAHLTSDTDGHFGTDTTHGHPSPRPRHFTQPHTATCDNGSVWQGMVHQSQVSGWHRVEASATSRHHGCATRRGQRTPAAHGHAPHVCEPWPQAT